MIVSYNWLKDFVDFDLAPAELAHLLTMLGLEVERMEEVGGGLDEVVVARVVEKAQHPNADKLSLCKIDNGREVIAVVCGAQNFKQGDTVALAQVGAVLPGDFKIKRSKIRGEESCGMLCSEKELGLAEESAGIMILPQEYTLGTPLFSALGTKDTIFEIGLTPNRADCLSVIGIAREIAAKLGTKVKYPGHAVVESDTPIESVASVTIEAPDLCPRYTARYIAGVKIGPSPQWLVSRLASSGMRSINNVVDVTNYVLMEYGHPLHAFDYNLLAGGKIIVRRAAEGEKFGTLDGQERTLVSSDLTIRDAERAVALAGIMGGGNSEINDATVNVLLESAYFAPSGIRKTSKRLGLHTESSHRFERGTDVNILTRALDRAASLIADLSGGKVAKGTIDVYPEKIAPRTVTARLATINAVIGLKLEADEVKNIFHNLEMGVEIPEPGVFAVKVPSFRVDIEREIDLVEEVARLKGFEQIPVTMPKARVFSDRPTLHQRVERRLKNLMVSHGFSEVVNFSFTAGDAFDKILLPADDPRRTSVKLLNPISDELSVMRTTLLPGLMETSARNFSYRILNQRLFELRRVYLPREGHVLPAEPVFLGGILTGRRFPEGWNQGKETVDFFDAKGLLEIICQEFGVAAVTWKAEETEPFFHPGKSCVLSTPRERLGSMGELHPDLLESYGIDQPVYYFEINVEALVRLVKEGTSITPPSRFPDTFRDIAMLIDDTVSAVTITDTIRGLKIKEVEGAEIFDVYKGSNIAADKKSIAVRVRYRSQERTLTDEEVTPLHQRIVDNLVKKLGIVIR